MKLEVISFSREFYEFRFFERNLNATFFVLIPKKGGVEEFKDLRSISLVSGLYKLFAMVLANRWKKAVGSIVSNS